MRGLTGALLLFALAPAAAASTWTRIPAFEYSHYGFVSDVGDATAIFLNPAGLSGGPGTNMYLDVTGDDNELTEYVVALQGKSLGFAYRHRDLHGAGVSPASNDPVLGEGNLDTYTGAGGHTWGPVSLGVGAVWTKTDLPGEDAFSWEAGLLYRVATLAAVGGRLSNIQHPDFLDGEVRPLYTYGFTLRPLFGMLTLSAQGSHEDGRADIIHMAYGAKLGLRSGLTVLATVLDEPGSDPTLGASVTYFFGKGAVSGRLRTLDGTDGYRGQVAIQAYDQFWQQGGAP
ncbi:MAG TPA: hypothetical protein VFP10_00340 [Candidatus Eisenbacteria bacterium]|nr:hypothetical protein [Candidatus Eisenbacteria bacterium]